MEKEGDEKEQTDLDLKLVSVKLDYQKKGLQWCHIFLCR